MKLRQDTGIMYDLPLIVSHYDRNDETHSSSPHIAAGVRAVRRRRRRRPHVGVAPAPFSWRVHVMSYTSYYVACYDYCNAVYNEA